MKEIEKPIIIFGTGRSGTTIFSDILFRHRDLAFPSNYQEFFPKCLLVNIIRFFFDNKIWRIFGERTYNRNFLNPKNYIFKPTEGYSVWEHITNRKYNFSESFLLNEKPTQKDVDSIKSYFLSIVKLQGKKRLALKLTGPSRIEFLSTIFPDAYFLEVRRRLIPTISSLLKTTYWNQKGSKELKWDGGVYDEEDKSWINQNKDFPELITLLQLKKIRQISDEEVNRIKPKHMIIEYEELMASPEEVFQEVFTFLKLNKDKDCSEYMKAIDKVNLYKTDQEYFNKEILERINNF